MSSLSTSIRSGIGNDARLEGFSHGKQVPRDGPEPSFEEFHGIDILSSLVGVDVMNDKSFTGP